MVTLLKDVQENEQRLTVLQLVDKIKIKHKEVGMFVACLSIFWSWMIYSYFHKPQEHRDTHTYQCNVAI